MPMILNSMSSIVPEPLLLFALPQFHPRSFVLPGAFFLSNWRFILQSFTGHIMFMCIVLMVLSYSPLRHGYRDYMLYCTILYTIYTFHLTIYLVLNVLGATGTSVSNVKMSETERRYQ
ncbi:hypothetical protein C8R48DRAFT_369708 [Suillus tomentosus]|nr:hypothetical protein C8R48DRAFT_369708 [Suillus tomentosus]